MLNIIQTNVFWWTNEIPLLKCEITGDDGRDQEPENKTENKWGDEDIARDIATLC